MSLRYPTEAHRRNTKWPTPPEAIEADALSVRDASEMLGVPYWWMSERIQSGKIKVLRFYLRPFVPLAEVKRIAAERRS